MRKSILGGLILLLALLVVGALVGRILGHGKVARFPSSYSGDGEGLLAFRRLLEELRVPQGVRSRPWDDGAADEGGVLVVATPLQRAVEMAEREALGEWIRRGGRLLVVDDATEHERSPMLDGLLDEAGLGAVPPAFEVDPRTLGAARPRVAAATGTPARPSGADLRRVMLHSESRMEEGFQGQPLALNSRGKVVAAEGSLGAGRIVRILGPLLANDRILEGDDLEFALRIVEDLRASGPVWFDEYHHGYGGMFPAARRLDRTALAWALLQGLAVCLLYAAARGIRFGPARAVPTPIRRSSLEFVHSMASLYKRAHAYGHVLDAMLARFAREARSRWGFGFAPSWSELARGIAQRTGLPEDRVARPLMEAHAALREGRLGEGRMLVSAAALARLEREVFGGN